MRPWVKYAALCIGLLAILAMATLVVGCSYVDGSEDYPYHVKCVD